MSERLTPEREAEIRTRELVATRGPWGMYEDGTGRIDVAADLAETGHGYRCRRGIAQLDTGPIDNDPTHRNWTQGEDNEQVRIDAEFVAHARDDVPALLAEIDRLRKSVSELADRAHRVAISHDHFMSDHSDPGTEALGAQYELMSYLATLPFDTKLPVGLLENALRLVLALLDQWDENLTPGEIRKALAEFLPREDLSDRRRRIYLDGNGDAWLSLSSEREIRYIGRLAGAFDGDDTTDSVRERTGSLREIGRCW
jgi:hypothetical protein